MKVLPLLTSVTLAMVLVGCANQKKIPNNAGIPQAEKTVMQQPSEVNGVIVTGYRAHIPADAALTVTLSDVSRADASPTILSQQVVLTGGAQPPFSFTLPFNQADITNKAHIIISGNVTVGGKLLMIGQETTPVITNGLFDADIILEPVNTLLMPQKSASIANQTSEKY